MTYHIVLHVAFHVSLSIIFQKPVFSMFDVEKIMSGLFHVYVCVSKLKAIFFKVLF